MAMHRPAKMTGLRRAKSATKLAMIAAYAPLKRDGKRLQLLELGEGAGAPPLPLSEGSAADCTHRGLGRTCRATGLCRRP
jgi:hypothetical protein